MSYPFRDETDRYTEPDETEGATVKVMEGIGTREPADWVDPSPLANIGFEDLSQAAEVSGAGYSRLAQAKPVSPRQKHIDDGAELAYRAVELFNEALDTISIVDLTTRDRYGKVLKDLASAAEDFERKL